MKFRNYCVIIMGITKGAKEEIIKIAETQPNLLDANAVLIATFSSLVEPRELTDYFKVCQRNFFLFDMNEENSGFHMMKKEINDGLFGFLGKMNEEGLKEKMDNLMQEISSSTKIINKKSDSVISIQDIDNMSSKDKNDLMNTLLSKGGENLSEYDKKILNILAI